MIVKLIAHAQAVADGNFQYLDELTESVDQSAPDETESPTSGEIASQFFELVIQMAANMIDPTWKTPWFLPGPLTPVGILAKKMAKKRSKTSTDDDAAPNVDADKDVCED